MTLSRTIGYAETSALMDRSSLVVRDDALRLAPEGAIPWGGGKARRSRSARLRAFLFGVDGTRPSFSGLGHPRSLLPSSEGGMTYLEAALMVLALGAALPAVAHTLLEVRRGLRQPRHWMTM